MALCFRYKVKSYVPLSQRFLIFFYLSTLLVPPKQSTTPYHWLTPGYYKDKVKTNVFLLPPHMRPSPAPLKIDFSTPWEC